MYIQSMMDGLSKAMQMQRQSYHLKLGQLIAFLKNCEGTLPVNFNGGGAPGGFASYRGYYEDLALWDAGNRILVAELLQEAKYANGKTFEGYKGGNFEMSDDTCLWRSEYGIDSGIAITGISKTDNAVTLHTKQVD